MGRWIDGKWYPTQEARWMREEGRKKALYQEISGKFREKWKATSGSPSFCFPSQAILDGIKIGYRPFFDWPVLCTGCVMNNPGIPKPIEGGKFYPEPHVMWLTWQQAFDWANSIGAVFKTIGTLRSTAIKRGVSCGTQANAPSRLAPVDRVSFQQFIYGHLDWRKSKVRRKKANTKNTED